MSAEAPAVEKPASKPGMAVALVALAVTIIIYFAPALPFALTNWDDNYYITMSPYIRTVHPQNIERVFTQYYFANYHPLTTLSYAVDYGVSVLHPWMYHAQNIAWHAALAVLIAVLLWKNDRVGASGVVLALFYAAHPLRFESVAWVSERKDVLSGFFYVAALLLRMSNLDADRSRYFRRVFPLEALLVLFAMLSKSMAVTYGAVAIACDLLLAKGRMKERWPAYVAFLGLGFLISKVNMAVQGGAMLSWTYIGLKGRFTLATHSPFFYLSKTLVPEGLSPFHPLYYAPTPFGARHWPALVMCASLAALVLLCWRRRPLVSFGILFFLLTLAPVSGVIPVGSAFAADRYSYLPSVGIIIAIGGALRGLRPNVQTSLAGLLMLSIFLSNPGEQLAIWRSSTTLWQRVLKVYPGYTEGRISIANDQYLHGKKEEALRGLSGVRDRTKQGYLEYQRFRIHFDEGDYEQAERDLLASPKPVTQLRGLVILYPKMGRWDEAVKAARELIVVPENRPGDIGFAAHTLLRAGRVEEVDEVIRNAKLPSIELATVMGCLANVMIERGNLDRARELAEEASTIDPSQYDTVRARAALFERMKKPGEGSLYLEGILGRADVPRDTWVFGLGMIGYFADVRGLQSRALDFYRYARREGSRDPIVLQNYLSILEARGLREEAELVRNILATPLPPGPDAPRR